MLMWYLVPEVAIFPDALYLFFLNYTHGCPGMLNIDWTTLSDCFTNNILETTDSRRKEI